jgi:hypothetical protein
MATSFNLGLSTEQFAKMSEAAVIMSRRLGTDANQAIGDLITGMSRMSKPTLDSLGIMVSVGDATEKYAVQLGKTSSELTDAEKRAAFMNATMAELDRLTGDASLSIGNAGDQLAILKNQLSDNTAELGSTLGKTQAVKDALGGMAAAVGTLSDVIKLADGNTSNWMDTMRKVLGWADALNYSLTLPLTLGLVDLPSAQGIFDKATREERERKIAIKIRKENDEREKKMMMLMMKE